MTKTIGIVIVVIAGLAGVLAFNRGDNTPTGGAAAAGGGRAGRPPMPVEFAAVKRAAVSEQILVVGNLIGAATVEVVPRANGRLQNVDVKLGDSVRQGQVIANVEDREIREQVRQAEASYKVSQASIRQREADLKLAQTNLDRSRSLYERQLLPQQTFDDADARYQAATAQLDLARAQFEQSKARLDELKITLHEHADRRRRSTASLPSAISIPAPSRAPTRRSRRSSTSARCGWSPTWSSSDMRRVPVGTAANVEVDAYPGETLQGTRQPRRAGVRPGDAHGRDRNRSTERRLPPQARACIRACS